MSERKILVADDEVVLHEIITRFLEKICSVKVDLAKNAAEAIGKAREADYELITMDNNMHDMLYDENSGIYAIREIRKFDQTVPIILVSGGLSIEAAEAARVAGVTEIVQKPDWNMLVQQARKYLGGGNEHGR